MKSLVNKIWNTLFSEELLLETKFFNITVMVAIVTYFMCGLTRAIMKTPWFFVVCMFSANVMMAVILYISVRFNKQRLCSWLAAALISFISMPVAFFFLNGQHGGMIAYFVLGIVVLFMLLRGKPFFVIMGIYVVSTVVCYSLDQCVPGMRELILELSGGAEYWETNRLWDNLQAFLAVGATGR